MHEGKAGGGERRSQPESRQANPASADAPAFAPYKPRVRGTPKTAVADLYDQVGGVPAVMVRLGIGNSQAYAFTDPEAREEISFARVAALTAPDATAAAEFLAMLAGGLFVPLPTGGAHTDLGLHTAKGAEDFGKVMGELVRDLAEGAIGTDRARHSIKLVDHVLRDFGRVRRDLLALIEARAPFRAPPAERDPEHPPASVALVPLRTAARGGDQS